MATSYKIRLKRFNGTDYDTLNLISDNIIMSSGNNLQTDFNGINTTLSDKENKKLQFFNTVVNSSSFVSDATYSDYPYRATITLTGVVNSMIPEVIFGLADAISGVFAPISESYNGGIYIYANDVPASNITIPTIICWRTST